MTKCGVFDHMDSTGDDPGQQYRDRLRLVGMYDRLGFHAYHLAEHHGTPLGLAPSPSVLLASVAERTSRLRFGSLVYTLSMHHPVRLIEEICMLDQLSGGRLDVGIGRGISPIEISFYGSDPAAARDIYSEALEIILQGLRGGRVDHDGKHFTFSDVPIAIGPRQQPHPPLWYGIARPETAAWAATNRINVVCNAAPATVRGITDRYRKEWANLGGEDAALPHLGTTRHVVVADTDTEAADLAQHAYHAWYASLSHLWVLHGKQIPAAYPQTSSEARAGGFLAAGSAATVRDELLADVRTSGINYLLARLAFGNLPVDASARSATLFATEVMPALESTTTRG